MPLERLDEIDLDIIYLANDVRELALETLILSEKLKRLEQAVRVLAGLPADPYHAANEAVKLLDLE
jgi:hypothetical protein